MTITPGPGEFESRLGYAGLFGLSVDEDEVERLYAVIDEPCCRFGRRTDDRLDALCDAGGEEVLFGDCRILLFEFERDDVSALSHRSRKPDGRIASECAELEDSSRTGDIGQESEERHLVGRDLGFRHRSGCADLRCVGGIFADECLSEVVVDCLPFIGCGCGWPVRGFAFAHALILRIDQ